MIEEVSNLKMPVRDLSKLSVKRKVFNALMGCMVWPINKVTSKPSHLSAGFHELLTMPSASIQTKYGSIKLYSHNSVLLMRARTFFTKEPETLDWIDGFLQGEVFYDIGANVGLYSLYAAMKDHKVLAIEPESQNYALCHQHIFQNRLGEKITLLPVALSDHMSVSELNLSRFMAGSALHNLDDELDFNKEPVTPAYKQKVMSYTLDGLIEQFNLAPPNHIKIDVDGIESEVILGAIEALKSTSIKSILVELNDALPSDNDIKTLLISMGFRVQLKKQSVGLSNRFKNIYNYILVKQNI